MQERKALTPATAARYQSARKKVKGKILDELTELTGYHRGYGRLAVFFTQLSV
ncbi:MAG TPA: hypothetical protein VGJ66_01780 [Pyrinomonadaceae bacterium]|jgi:hypothetical protein